MIMKISQSGVNFIAKEEGWKNVVYLDSRGLPTIGVGHLLTKSELSSGKILIKGEYIKYRNGLTDKQVQDLFDQDLDKYENCVNDCFKIQTSQLSYSGYIKLTQGQFDALVSLCFNIGQHAFKTSTLVKLLKKGLFKEIPFQFKRWKYSNGKPILLERRKREVEIWKNEDYNENK